MGALQTQKVVGIFNYLFNNLFIYLLAILYNFLLLLLNSY